MRWYKAHYQGISKTLEQSVTWPNHSGPCSSRCPDLSVVCFPTFSLRPRDGGRIKTGQRDGVDVLRKACELQKLLSLSHQLRFTTTERAAAGGDCVTNSRGSAQPSSLSGFAPDSGRAGLPARQRSYRLVSGARQRKIKTKLAVRRTWVM